MATKILWHLFVYLTLAVIGVVVGKLPGMIAIHPSGSASYVNGSHCIISTEVPQVQFVELTEWCVSKHKGK